jgi:hypothetical protein
MSPNFRTGAVAARPTFEMLSLPYDQRLQLVLALMEEFGAEGVSVRGNEVYHRCNLPPPIGGHHANGDRNPSARVNVQKMTMKCWACGGGGFLWWIATMRGEDSIARVKEWLAKETGVGGVQGFDELMRFIDSVLSAPDSFEEQQVIPNYDRRVLDGWSFIHPYLTEFRGVPAQNVIDSNVGYGTLRIRVGEEQFQESERIIIPHFWKGDLVGWQSRRLTDDGTPKYMSTPTFPKDVTLYNFDSKAESVVVVEAPISVVKHRHVTHMEATFGASVTHRQMDLIGQHQGDIVLWMDNDPAGWKATEELCEFLYQRTSRLYVIDSPYAADAGDMSADTVALALAEWRVPWTLWQPPRSLLEWSGDEGGLR